MKTKMSERGGVCSSASWPGGKAHVKNGGGSPPGVGRAREGREKGARPRKEADGTEHVGKRRKLVSSSGSTWWQGLEGQDERERERQEREPQTSRADRHISGSSPPPKAWISLSFCQKLSGSLVVKTGPNPAREERKVRWWSST